MNQEFFVSIIEAFGISCLIAICLHSIGHFIHPKQLSENMSSNEELRESSEEGFDDEIIKLTNERILQEFHLSSSIENKSSILIGTLGLIFVVITTSGLPFFLEIIKTNFLIVVPIVLGITFLILSFILSFGIIRPKIRFKLINPRRANNSFSNLSLNETKDQIKKNLIDNFEFIQQESSNDLKFLNISYAFFIIGILMLAIPWIYNGAKAFFI